ncbi:MAG: phage tail protein, partial [Caldilineaceae bacterium]|nr:phage tail protein [Caldilineaceae bacterium]
SLQFTGGPTLPTTAFFREISGIGVEYGVAEHKTVSESGIPFIQKIPARPTYSPITLKRGIASDLSLWLWHKMVVDEITAELARTNVQIVMYSRMYLPVLQWSLKRAWPSKISGPQFQTDSTDVAMEELTLVHEGIEIDTMGSMIGRAAGLL